MFCSGTLITDQLLITAAHCFQRLETRDLVLVLGSVFSRGHRSPHHQIRRVEKLFKRDDFEIETYNNDIAIIKMDRKVEFSDVVRPLCLPDNIEDYTGMIIMIIFIVERWNTCFRIRSYSDRLGQG